MKLPTYNAAVATLAMLAADTPQRRQLTFHLFGWTGNLTLTTGTLGLAVIVILFVLLAVVAVLAVFARSRAKQAEIANRKLERKIEEHRRAEEAVTELNAALQIKVELLGRANADLEQFAFAASHDLREPLRLVVSYAQLLLRRTEGSTDAIAREYAEFLRTSVDRMRGLIDGLLAYSQASHDSANAPAYCDAYAIAHEAVLLFADAIQESGATVVIDQLPAVAVGEMPLLRLFQNLIGNALKYRRADEPPSIRVSAVESGREVRFAIRDNGIGIEPEYHAQIFGLFRRLHGNEYPGLGVGLASCKRVVDHYEGRIWVESIPGVGSTFYLALPAVRAGSRAAAAGSGG